MLKPDAVRCHRRHRPLVPRADGAFKTPKTVRPRVEPEIRHRQIQSFVLRELRGRWTTAGSYAAPDQEPIAWTSHCPPTSTTSARASPRSCASASCRSNGSRATMRLAELDSVQGMLGEAAPQIEIGRPADDARGGEARRRRLRPQGDLDGQDRSSPTRCTARPTPASSSAARAAIEGHGARRIAPLRRQAPSAFVRSRGRARGKVPFGPSAHLYAFSVTESR